MPPVSNNNIFSLYGLWIMSLIMSLLPIIGMGQTSRARNAEQFGSCRPPVRIEIGTGDSISSKVSGGSEPVRSLPAFQHSLKVGDSLWFDLTLLDSAFLGSTVRIDLVNPYFSVCGARLIRMESMRKSGYFPLSDTISQGPYCLRAYLLWDDLSISGSVRTYLEVLNPKVRPQDYKVFRQTHSYWMRKTGLKKKSKSKGIVALPLAGSDSCLPGKRPYIPRVEGRVMRDLVSVPVEGATVSLFDLDEYFTLLSMQTDAAGRFRFDLEEARDSAFFVVESYNKKGQKSYLLELSFFDPPPFAPDTTMLRWFEGKFNGRAQYSSTVRTEVARTSVHGRADYVLYPDQGSAGRYMSILDYMDGRVPGVDIEGVGGEKMAIIRGMSTISGNPEALYLIDDVPASRQTVNALNPDDVERVEVIKNGSGLSMYGLRGGNGVIAIYTRRGMQGSFGELRLILIGFHEVP